VRCQAEKHGVGGGWLVKFATGDFERASERGGVCRPGTKASLQGRKSELGWKIVGGWFLFESATLFSLLSCFTVERSNTGTNPRPTSADLIPWTTRNN
jgi:hypothetical protein